MIAARVPLVIRRADAATQAAVLPMVRELVAAVGPPTPSAAQRLLWALPPMGVWLYHTLGVFDAATVNHENVETWLAVNGGRKVGWRNAARSALRTVGVVVNPDGWPRQSKQLSRPPAVDGYPPRVEALYIEVADLAGFENPEGRRWVVAGSLGAALSGPELAAAEIGDLRDLSGGRLAVRVRGRNSRLVPIRGCCTHLVRQAVSIVQQRPAGASHRFVLATTKNAATRIANAVTIGRGRGLSLRRARNTWLIAHLRAETPLLALNAIARPLSAATLNDLLTVSGDSIDAEEAVVKGLRA